MSQRPTFHVAQESYTVSARSPESHEAAGHGAGSPGNIAMFHGTHNLQIEGSTMSVAGRDVIHNRSIHYHHERPQDIWGILRSIPNFRKINQDMMSKATPGTGMWLVKGEKFRIWLEPNGDIKIIWGSGIPGAGKTLLASIVIEHLEALRQNSDAKICVCYVYFRYSNHSEVTVRNVLETFVKQTLERHPSCRSVIDNTYGQHLREGTEPTEAQLMGLLRELADGMSCTFYILDALDEAPTKVQLAVVRVLASLNVKLFITSRPLKPLEAHFPHTHSFVIAAHEGDLDLHIAKGIDEDVELQMLLRTSPSLQDEIFSTIKRNCSGMFLHASLQLDALHDCANVHEVKRRLKEFPSSIEGVYLQTWDRILKQNAHLVSVAKAALVWVLNASRSLTVQELERAVATSPDNHKFEVDRLVPGVTLMSLCRGLITVEEDSGIVRLVHYTAKETLETLLHETFPHPHSLLAAVCMANLTECGFQNTKIRSRQEFKVALNREPLLAYASEAWAFHAGQSLDDDDGNSRTAQFVSESKAFPAFTSPSQTRYFDILTPLHIVGLYRLPLAVVRDGIKGSPNVTTAVLQQSPLMIASESGHEDLVAHLIALSTIEANLVDTDGWSALMLAAHLGHEGIVKLLLVHPKIQVNMVNTTGSSALMRAVSKGHKGIVKLLLAHPETQVNLVNTNGWSALMRAASKGHEGVVKLLLRRPEIQVNLVNNDGWSALIWAAYWGHESVTKLLLAHPKLQVNLVDSNGWSALMSAAHRGHEGVVKLLLAHPELQINLVDNFGWSALMRAASKGHEGVSKLLLAHPELQVNLLTNAGTALMHAASKGQEGVLKFLLTHPEIQVNVVDEDGWSILMLAASRGEGGVVKLLLEHPDIQLNLADNRGSTALLLAAAYGHIDIVDLLLTTRAFDVNAFDNDRDTAIKMAAKGGHTTVVRMLVDIPNIDITTRSITDGHTAISAAQAKGYNTIVELLRNFESQKGVMASSPEISQLSLHGEEVYYDTEEEGD